MKKWRRGLRAGIRVLALGRVLGDPAARETRLVAPVGSTLSLRVRKVSLFLFSKKKSTGGLIKRARLPCPHDVPARRSFVHVDLDFPEPATLAGVSGRGLAAHPRNTGMNVALSQVRLVAFVQLRSGSGVSCASALSRRARERPVVTARAGKSASLRLGGPQRRM